MEGDSFILIAKESSNAATTANSPRMMDEEDVKNQIEKLRGQIDALQKESDCYEKEKQDLEVLTKTLQEKGNKVQEHLKQDAEEMRRKEQKNQEKVRAVNEENAQLEKEAESLLVDIGQIQEKKDRLKKISASGSEKKMVFKGKVSNDISDGGLLCRHRILQPFLGGSALVTFEQAAVAATVIKKREHQIDIDGCVINVKAEPVELEVLDTLSVDLSISTHKILVSNLPNSIEEEKLKDKLEIFFTKTRNGGGEVDSCETLDNCKNVVISFIDDKVAPRLTEKKHIQVPIDNKHFAVHVTPSLDGDLKDYSTKRSACNRTVQITGIPNITDPDNMQDLLELHFQKPSVGGGEVQVLQYVPEGKYAVAIFEDDDEDE